MKEVDSTSPSPLPTDALAVRAFEDQARKMGLDPSDRWVGGYVRYEWEKLRPVLAAYEVDLRGRRVLEFGCNYGGSSIVMAFLGAEVHGVDIDPSAVLLARCNAAQYGLDDINLQPIADGRRLPFADQEFDFVLCNSVLEYVSPDHLAGVIAELRRTMKPGAPLFITGTSSRLAPKEVHSGRWLVNYLPKRLDRYFATAPQRGVNPFALRRLLRGGFVDEDAGQAARRWLHARAATRGATRAPLPFRLLARVASVLGVGPGWLTPNISVLLRRRP